VTVECTIRDLRGEKEVHGVWPLQMTEDKARIIISTVAGTQTPLEYLEVAPKDLFPQLHPQAQADYLIAEPLDGRKLQRTDAGPP
jgi:hypothetical protein